MLVSAQEELEDRVTAAAPVREGKLRAAIAKRGEPLKRAVAIDVPYAKPVEFGWTPSAIKSQANLVRNTYTGKGKGKGFKLAAQRARQVLAFGKIPGQRYAYGPFDEMAAGIQKRLDQAGVGIVRELSR